MDRAKSGLMGLRDHDEHPFWSVFLLSCAVCVAALSTVLVALFHTGAVQYQWLSALLAAVLLSHFGAWAVFARKKRFGKAIWWIAHTLIISSVLVPLLISDYLLKMPLLLLAVPLNICIANRLRNIPTAFAYTLLAAAFMVAADLAAPFPRRALFGDVPQLHLVPLVLQLGYIAALCFLVWFYRIRPTSPRFTRLNLASQQTLPATAISAASLLAVTALLAFLIRGSQVTQIGLSHQLLANSFAERTAGNLEQAVYALVRLGQDPIIQKGLQQANARYPADAAQAAAILRAGEAQWEAAKVGNPMLFPYRDTDQILALANFRHSEHSHRDLFLTDSRGGLVAAQGNKPPRFSFADEAWWQAVWQEGIGGIYFGPVHINPRTNLPYTFIAVGVLDTRSNKLLGVLASTFDLLETQNLYAGFEGTGGERVQLVAADGRIIAASGDRAPGQKQTRWRDFAGHARFQQEATSFAQDPPGWLLGVDEGGRDAVIGHAPLHTFSGIFSEALASLGCRVVVSKSRQAALLGVTRSTKIAAVVGLIAMALSVFAAWLAATWVAKPINELTLTAKAMVGGDLEKDARLAGTEELISLAQSFNTLMDRLREKIDDLEDTNRTLEDRVSERTEKLRRAQKSLIDGAHYSGMAEVARGVLHNIGNVLNSLNVSVQTSLQLLQESQVTKLENINSLMSKTDAELTAFLADPAKREALAEYVSELVQSLQNENRLFSREVNQIREQAEIIRQSLLAQSKFTDRDLGYAERLDINEIIADLLYAEKEMLDRFHIQTSVDFGAVPAVAAMRTKLSYAVLTLLENAVDALADNPTRERHISVQTACIGEALHIRVGDNGKGIPEALRTKIFQYGFTTKPEGNGFGLHTCANALREMGGDVRAESEGPGRGAVFVLTLPLDAQAAASANPSEGEPDNAGPTTLSQPELDLAQRGTAQPQPG
ncbi:ATP-binding protein [Acanthopleuribacter pedis]|uniref:histidine kinase n=1 Tax=Acanthopleuribacter pedis TaxID=442870 RepID=A0A8J7QJP3_9BACT|nr:ATP-binding protein [Acanthopleuribacter pedis]MBO1319463.1 HAMP domain-containing protein [Acanthopleuribacter pedis]